MGMRGSGDPPRPTAVTSSCANDAIETNFSYRGNHFRRHIPSRPNAGNFGLRCVEMDVPAGTVKVRNLKVSSTAHRRTMSAYHLAASSFLSLPSGNYIVS